MMLDRTLWRRLAVLPLLTLIAAAVTVYSPVVGAQDEPVDCSAFDFDGNGWVNDDDVAAWERYYEAGDILADIDGDTSVTKDEAKPFVDAISKRICRRPSAQDPAFSFGAGTDAVESVDAIQGMDATGGPDAFGYIYADQDDGAAYDFIDINGSGSLVGTGDDVAFSVNLQAPFDFYGQTLNAVGMSSNGYISSDPNVSGGDLSNDCPIPAPPSTGGGARIYVNHDDLNVTGGGQMLVEYFSTCPRPSDFQPTGDCTVLQWDAVQHFSTSNPWDQQVVLYHQTGELVIQVGPGNPEAGSSSTTGIQNDGATTGLNYACNTAGSMPGDQAISFRLPQFDGVGGDAVGPGVAPNLQLGKQVHLPILNFQGQDDVCRTWIEVQYIGCDPSKAVLVTWGEPGFCPPQAAGPLKVECTGLLNPGSTWNLLGAQIPTGSKSGILFKFTAQQLSDVGLDDDLGFDDVVADLMCETLFFGVVGDSDDYRRFKKAYNEGLDFAGIPQDIASGEGVLAVEVLRHCPGDVTPGVEVSSKYNGIAGTHLGTYDPIYGSYIYHVALIYADKAGLNTVMYIQNGGLQCSSVEIWFKAQDDCLRARICEIFTLAPGESYQWDASDCVGPDWQGSANLRASQPLGIAVDVYGRDVLMTYVAEPLPFVYELEDGEGGTTIVASPPTGETVAYGPLIYSEYQGWDTGVQVANASPVYNAKVKVYFLDRSGDVITTLVDWICPQGSQTFFLPVVADLPGSWVGSIRVESQDWWTPGTNPVAAPGIVGAATLIKYSDVARTQTEEAVAYSLLPEHKSYVWQVGSGDGGLYSGVGLIAIPSLLKDLDGTGTTSELAIMNLVTKPGFTDFAIYIYDQNGLLDFVCQKLHDRQVEYIDLQTWGYVNNGFKGSAIISATFWEHDVFDGEGTFVRNLVGLGAVSIERTGTRLNEDVPGDEAAGSRGIPFQRDRDLEACFGGFVPRCPGQPQLITVVAENAFSASSGSLGAGFGGFAFGDPATQTGLTVDAPDACKITDVNLDVEITSQFFGDISVNLERGGAGPSEMFSSQCGTDQGLPWVATLDDDAAASFTAVCGATTVNNGTFKTESGSGLDAFDGVNAAGDWTISLYNPFQGFGGEDSFLNSWGVNGTCETRTKVLVTP